MDLLAFLFSKLSIQCPSATPGIQSNDSEMKGSDDENAIGEHDASNKSEAAYQDLNFDDPDCLPDYEDAY